jgi:hypothetical protein
VWFLRLSVFFGSSFLSDRDNRSDSAFAALFSSAAKLPKKSEQKRTEAK